MSDGDAHLTETFSIAASRYLPHVAARLFWRYWWVLTLPAALICYGLAADWRWAVVGLILLMIVYPMVNTLAVLRYATSDKVLRRSATAQVRFGAGGSLTMLDAEGREIEKAAMSPYPSISRGLLVLTLGPAPDDILLLPAEAARALPPDSGKA